MHGYYEDSDIGELIERGVTMNIPISVQMTVAESTASYNMTVDVTVLAEPDTITNAQIDALFE